MAKLVNSRFWYKQRSVVSRRNYKRAVQKSEQKQKHVLPANLLQ